MCVDAVRTKDLMIFAVFRISACYEGKLDKVDPCEQRLYDPSTEFAWVILNLFRYNLSHLQL